MDTEWGPELVTLSVNIPKQLLERLVEMERQGECRLTSMGAAAGVVELALNRWIEERDV